MDASSLQTCHHNDPVGYVDVDLLMAEPGLLESELASNCVENSNSLQPNEVLYGHVSSLPHKVLVPPSISSPHKLPIETQRSEQPVAQSSAQSYWSPVQSVSSVPCLQKIPGQTPGLDFALPNPVPVANFVEQAATTVGFPQCQLLYGPTTSGTNEVELQSAPFEQPTVEAVNEHIVIDSSSEELEYSELSDSDTMEECYRIFMEEANKGEEGSTDQACTPVSASKHTLGGIVVQFNGDRKMLSLCVLGRSCGCGDTRVSSETQTVARTQEEGGPCVQIY